MMEINKKPVGWKIWKQNPLVKTRTSLDENAAREREHRVVNGGGLCTTGVIVGARRVCRQTHNAYIITINGRKKHVTLLAPTDNIF